jgi:hypothetical protein
MGVSFLMKNVKAIATFPPCITNGPRTVNFFCAWKWICGPSCNAHSVIIDETSAYTFSALSFRDPTKPFHSEQIHQWQAKYTGKRLASIHSSMSTIPQRFCCCPMQRSDKSYFVLMKKEIKTKNALNNSLHLVTTSLRGEIQLIMTEACLYVNTSKKGQAITY